MAFKDDLLSNYLHPRHFLQTVYMPAFKPKGSDFVYMKNHKAACTTVIATLMAHLLHEMKDDRDISMENVHQPPRDVIHAGKRALGMPRVLDALQSKDVFRFTAVRDPIARTVSAYADKIARGDKQKRKLMNHLGRDKEDDLSLSQFLDVMAQDEGAQDVDRHWRPQVKEISYGLIKYDVIGTTDDLTPALKEIVYACFKLKRPKMQDTRSSMGHQTASKDLIASMTKEDMRNLERAFEADLQMYEEVKAAQAKAAA
ncbi:sulfotransferase family 2 domain-containing protein [Nereida sp. MMG025]|uniref:sulfotransferase family 2 domain-containing protein n=1 Tax=Nereida sp. MMG025 TaxID=2909981 RepID=UPI001F1599AA|nr:sulfotransferase family 2 domain-containing protein [Nereida sp. MMG025]MCF6445478.1 sulfotransferase family protein [Nereida sp. MMG025]